jgi:hypothetical protein
MPTEAIGTDLFPVGPKPFNEHRSLKGAPVPEREVGHVHGNLKPTPALGESTFEEDTPFSEARGRHFKKARPQGPTLGPRRIPHSVSDRSEQVPGSIPIQCLYNAIWLSCGVRAPAVLAVRERAARRQL